MYIRSTEEVVTDGPQAPRFVHFLPGSRSFEGRCNSPFALPSFSQASLRLARSKLQHHTSACLVCLIPCLHVQRWLASCIRG